MKIPPNQNKLPGWLQFDDWLGYAVDKTSSLIVRGTRQTEHGTYTETGWVREGLCDLVTCVNARDQIVLDFDL